MRTEARFLLAVFLMLAVLVGTNRLFPPIIPEEGLLPDSLAGDSAGEVTTPSTGVPEIPETEPAPTIPGPEQDLSTTSFRARGLGPRSAGSRIEGQKITAFGCFSWPGDQSGRWSKRVSETSSVPNLPNHPG